MHACMPAYMHAYIHTYIHEYAKVSTGGLTDVEAV